MMCTIPEMIPTSKITSESLIISDPQVILGMQFSIRHYGFDQRAIILLV